MNYAIGDIHNDNRRFSEMLEKIAFSEHFTEVDMLNLAKKIMEWPLQICVEVDGEKYLLAHAYTSMPDRVMVDEFYLMGVHFVGRESYEMFLLNGREVYTSVCGHANIMGNGKIWKNKLKNVYICDCGYGFQDGRLGCLCLETKEETYV